MRNGKERFEKFIEIVLKNEGGYVNDPDDWGKETNMGITKRRYPDEDIKGLTVKRAKELYWKDFFKPLKLYYVKDDELALHIFDMAVNANRHVAIVLLQDILNGCETDGFMGPITAHATANALITTNLIKAYKAKRIEYYYKMTKYERNKKFLKGWVNRVYNTKL